MRYKTQILLLVNLMWMLGCTTPDLERTLPAIVPDTVVPLPETSATQAHTQTPTLTASPTATLLPTLTLTPSLTPTQTSTPEPLPVFQTRSLRPGVMPQVYLDDPCTYLYQRWSKDGSSVGTVVVPVMFHSIRQDGRPISDNTSIYQAQFDTFIAYADTLGFQTITTDQLIAFLDHNASIPERALLMIVDDRRPGTIETSFLPVLEPRQWTVTLGWIVSDTNEAEWDRLERMVATGLLDMQSHGMLHHYVTDQMSEAEMRNEIFSPIAVFEQHFGIRPIAFIWPGGNFNRQSASLAREAGYQVGFTAYARGPLMFNWIPLGAEEQAVNDPLMVLPRFWSTALGVNLDVAVRVSEQAKADAAASYEAEAQYFRTYCGGELPPRP